MGNKDLVAYLELYGVENTFDILLETAKGTRPIALNEKQEFKPISWFEIDLFCMSYYLFYLTNRKSSKVQELLETAIIYYSTIPDKILDPVERKMYNMVVTNKKEYILEKIIEYQRQIVKHFNDENFLPKYLFNSFFIFPAMPVSSLKQGCSIILDSIAARFNLVVVAGMIEFLNTTCEKIMDYIEISSPIKNDNTNSSQIENGNKFKELIKEAKNKKAILTITRLTPYIFKQTGPESTADKPQWIMIDYCNSEVMFSDFIASIVMCNSTMRITSIEKINEDQVINLSSLENSTKLGPAIMISNKELSVINPYSKMYIIFKYNNQWQFDLV